MGAVLGGGSSEEPAAARAERAPVGALVVVDGLEGNAVEAGDPMELYLSSRDEFVRRGARVASVRLPILLDLTDRVAQER